MSSATTNPAPSPDADSGAATVNVLRILSGLHAGASRTLAEREMILVGSGDDCDIVLADSGVARHHALINLVGGMSSLRALDAPLRIDGQPLHPGDPVELRGLQRIQLGDAAIAYGAEDDAGWDSLLPTSADAPPGARPTRPGLRHLPAIAALAVLSLASLAIYAAVMPEREKPADPQAQLTSLIAEYRIKDGAVGENVNGAPVLSGTVRDNATEARIASRLQELGIEATLDLRTGEDIAADVSEALRAQDINAKTYYVGNGVVEAHGRFEDMDRLRVAVKSRTMHEIDGVDTVLAENYATPKTDKDAPASEGGKGATQGPTRIVSIVRGADAHLVDVDGVEYPVGADVPGHGRLLSIGTTAHVIADDGMLHEVEANPVTAEELAAAAEDAVAAQVQVEGQTEEQDPGAADGSAVAEQLTTTASAKRTEAKEKM